MKNVEGENATGSFLQRGKFKRKIKVNFLEEIFFWKIIKIFFKKNFETKFQKKNKIKKQLKN